MPLSPPPFRGAFAAAALSASLLLAHPADSAADAANAEAPADPSAVFEQLRPVLEAKCLSCHNPNNIQGDMSLATAGSALNPAAGLVTPGDALASELYRVTIIDQAGGESRPYMPKEGEPLTDAEAELLRAWIDAGAPWPDGLVLREASKADRSWWAYQPLDRGDPADVSEAPESWRHNPVDAHIFEQLRAADLQPNPPADRATLVRRAYYTLLGLPPTPEQVEQFVNNTDPHAWEQLIDQLLDSPHYGERWGRHWLDVVRFGESRGYERNQIIDNAWPFRDYIIRSFNNDKPFNQLIREHLAGDVIGGGDPEVEIGSAFLVAGPYDDVGNQDPVQARQIRANILEEIISTTSEAFLGMSMGCARCHDHKFDPILIDDYYQLYATFAGVEHGERVLATEEDKAADQAARAPLSQRRESSQQELNAITGEVEQRIQQREADLVAAWTRDPVSDNHRRHRLHQAVVTEEETADMARLRGEIGAIDRDLAALPRLPVVWVGLRNQNRAAGPFHVFVGGSPEQPGDAVVPASLSTLEQVTPGYQLEAGVNEGQRRLALADWLVQPNNPLTPRVLVNRIWHHHFGTGIVDTPNDFGYMGGQPSHPRLLDDLALRVVNNDWRIKDLHRLLMTSQTWQQSSEWRESAAAVDSDSRLLWRFPPRRLDAEEIRDTMLRVAGRLDPGIGGRGFRLYHYTQDNVATYIPLDQHGENTWRRGIYHQNARASTIDLLSEFDQPDCAFSIARRDATTTPMQALVMMNHSFTFDMARGLAERVEREVGEETGPRLARAMRLAWQRDPDEQEIARAREFVDTHGWTAFCRALLNTSEMVYLD